MKLVLLELDPLPHPLCEQVLSSLAPPWQAAGVRRARLDLQPLIDRRRGQLDAARLLQALPRPPPGHVYVGLTSHDLFLPVMAYISGLAPLRGRVAVASIARLGVGPGGPDQQLARTCARLRVEVIHEAGHAVGLLHCPVPRCAMHQSLSAEELDLKDPLYCPACEQGLRQAWAGGLA